MLNKKLLHGSLWKEGLAFVIAVLLIFKLVMNIGTITNVISHFMSVISPFLVGTTIAYFLSRPADKVEARFRKSKIPLLVNRARGFSVLTVFLIVVAIISLIISYMIPIIIANLLDFGSSIGALYEVLMDSLYGLDTADTWLSNFITDDMIASITEALSFQELIVQIGNSAFSVVQYLISMTSGIINTFISVIISLYMLIFKDSVLALIDRIAKAFIKERPLNSIKSYIGKSNNIFFQFISAQFLDACVLGTLATILLSVIGVEYAVTLGLLLGICNMIPYFGSMFASILTAVITLFTGGVQLALITAISLLVLQQIDGNFIGPRIMGDALSLNPMLIILSITVGGAYFGIIGMFVSVPVAAMLKMFLDDFLTLRERKKELVEDATCS